MSNDNLDDLTDDERAEYEQAWADLDEKVLLAQILTELQQIRLALTAADTGASDDADGNTPYRCRECQQVVKGDARKRHAQKQHKCPPDMVDSLFEEVDR